MVVVALLSVDLVESVDLVSVYLVVNCTEGKKIHLNFKMRVVIFLFVDVLGRLNLHS